MGQVVHFEITADDIARAKKFYEIFGWKTEDAMMPGIEYWLVKTGSDDVTKNGAIMSRQYSKQPVINWISVDDLDKMVEEVKKSRREDC
jgi:predicted enzyme related to lactoylglutathione lyase